jgi:UDP-N-acetylglucosamine 4,6-dehydratase
MVRTNVDGALNVVEAAKDAGVKKVVFLSTDKAFQPVSPYGQSKALAEAIFLAANGTVGASGPRFTVTRYGNVWGSAGSIYPIWRALLCSGVRKVPVTDPDCTRFFMLMREAVSFVLRALGEMKPEVCIPDLPAFRIGDLAEAMGLEQNVIGLPPWEKKHESMCEGKSSDEALRLTIEELKEHIKCDPTPMLQFGNLKGGSQIIRAPLTQLPVTDAPLPSRWFANISKFVKSQSRDILTMAWRQR